MTDDVKTDVKTDAPADGIPTLLSVTKGNPTDEELAALLLVGAAAASGEPATEEQPTGIWASRARNLGVSSLGARRRSSWGWRSAR